MRNGAEYVRCSACKLLFAASKTPRVRDAVVQLEGVAMLLLVMREHSKHAGVNEYATKALANLEPTPEVCGTVLEQDGLKLLFNAMNRFQKEVNVEVGVSCALDHLLDLVVDSRAAFSKFSPLEVMETEQDR